MTSFIKMLRLATDDEIACWDELVLANPDGGHYFQSRAWGEFKSRHGWRPSHWVYGGEQLVAVQFLSRSVFGLGEIWYAPKGPGVVDVAQLGLVADAAKGLTGAFGRFDAEIAADLVPQGVPGLVRASQDVQFGATAVVELGLEEDALLASFKPKTRYNIRLAAKKGVEVKPAEPTAENLKLMYKMMEDTQRRGGFFLRPRRYFEDYWHSLTEAGLGQLWFASYQGEVLHGAFIVTFGRKAWYKDGASTGAHRELMAPQLMQWEVMRAAKRRGVESYDLVGLPPQGAGLEHPLHGLEQFKLGFSPRRIDFIGAYDLALSPRYSTWRRLERYYNKVYQVVRRDLFY